MAKSLPAPSFNNIGVYKTIRDILSKPVDVSKLPIIGESKIFKASAGRYGHVILMLDLEKEAETSQYSYGGLNYGWEVAENYEVAKDERYQFAAFLPISKEYFETEIINEIKFFNSLFRILNDNNIPLKLSVIGGSYKESERPYFSTVTAEAIAQIFKQLHEEK